MTNIDKIKNEIEKRINMCGIAEWMSDRKRELKEILSFIESLEQESKRDPSTEERYKVFCEKCSDEGIEPPTYEVFSKRK